MYKKKKTLHSLHYVHLNRNVFSLKLHHMSVTAIEKIVQNLDQLTNFFRLSCLLIYCPPLILWYYHGTFQRNHDITMMLSVIDQKVMLCFAYSLKFSSMSAFHAGSGVHVWEVYETSPFYVLYRIFGLLSLPSVCF